MKALNKVPENDAQQFHRPDDPSTEMKPCELPGCNEKNIIGNMYSIKNSYALAGPMKPAFQCPETQHYACSHEHAMLLSMHCLFEHVHCGPHAQYGQDIAHSKLKRIESILSEPYRGGK